MNPPATIRVTAEHIARGERRNGFGCPIALAMCEQGGWEPGDVVVGDYVIAPWTGGDISAILPPEAYTFTRDFDDGEPVEPLTFDVDWEPSEALS